MASWSSWPWPGSSPGNSRLREEILILVGTAIVAWELFVPIVGARVIDAMAASRPFQEVALLIVGLSMVVWVPTAICCPTCSTSWT